MNGQSHSTFLLSTNDTINREFTINRKYTIIRGLGKGGFSETYLVREFNQKKDVDDSQYVLKLLNTDNENERQKVQKHFEREARILNDLGNQNQNKNIAIPTIIDKFEWQLENTNQNTYCIVETYFEGISLDLKMDENDSFSEEEVKNFLEQILNILDFLHDKSKNNIDIFTHRDVSPNNIICQADGTYALIDFGTIISEKYKDFARNLHSIIEQNEKTRIGTRGYTHIAQEYGKVDILPNLDIYSLGRIAVQMLTGEPPDLLFPGNYDPRLDNIPNITDEFKKFLIKMTYYEHDKRFQSAGEALIDLKRNQSHFDELKPLKSKKGYIFISILFLISTLISIFIVPQIQEFRLITSLDSQVNKPKQKFQDVQNIPSGLFKNGGSSSVAIIRGEIEPCFSPIIDDRRESKLCKEEPIFPNFQILYWHPHKFISGSAEGVERLLKGDLDISMSSLSKNRISNLSPDDQNKIKQIPIALDAIAIAINPNLDIDSLTIEQIKKIYLGEIRDWQEINPEIQESIPIMPLSKGHESGTVRVFKSSILHDKRYGSNVDEQVESTTEALKEISKNKSKLYFASASQIINECFVKAVSILSPENKTISLYKDKNINPKECEEKKEESEKKKEFFSRVNVDLIENEEYPKALIHPIYVFTDNTKTISEKVGLSYAALLLTQEGQDKIYQLGIGRCNIKGNKNSLCDPD